MPSLTNIVTAITAMASLAAAAPAPGPFANAVLGEAVRITSNDDLSKRADPIPEGCDFSFGGKIFDFTYRPVTGIDGNPCLGWNNGGVCGGDGPWPDPDFTDIQTVIGRQVTLDGQLESAKSNDWEGSFPLGTTAFSNRDSTAFNFFFLDHPLATEFYWSIDGNQAVASNKAFLPCP